VICWFSKSHHLPIYLVEYYSVSPSQLTHSNVWHSPIISYIGFQYYAIFVDDTFVFTWFYHMKQKFDLLLFIFIIFKTMNENQFGTTIEIFQSGRAEFNNSHGKELFINYGIFFLKSHPWCSSSIIIVEHEHQHILQIVRVFYFNLLYHLNFRLMELKL